MLPGKTYAVAKLAIKKGQSTKEKLPRNLSLTFNNKRCDAEAAWYRINIIPKAVEAMHSRKPREDLPQGIFKWRKVNVADSQEPCDISKKRKQGYIVCFAGLATSTIHDIAVMETGEVATC